MEMISEAWLKASFFGFLLMSEGRDRRKYSNRCSNALVVISTLMVAQTTSRVSFGLKWEKEVSCAHVDRQIHSCPGRRARKSVKPSRRVHNMRKFGSGNELLFKQTSAVFAQLTKMKKSLKSSESFSARFEYERNPDFPATRRLHICSTKSFHAPFVTFSRSFSLRLPRFALLCIVKGGLRTALRLLAFSFWLGRQRQAIASFNLHSSPARKLFSSLSPRDASTAQRREKGGEGKSLSRDLFRINILSRN